MGSVLQTALCTVVLLPLRAMFLALVLVTVYLLALACLAVSNRPAARGEKRSVAPSSTREGEVGGVQMSCASYPQDAGTRPSVAAANADVKACAVSEAGAVTTAATTLEEGLGDTVENEGTEQLSAVRKALITCILAVIRAGTFVCFGVHRVYLAQPPGAAGAEVPASARGLRRECRRRIIQTPLCVANHLGWLDVLVLLSHLRCTFVAQDYVKHTPIVGTVARALCVIFVGSGRPASAAIHARLTAAHACDKGSCGGCGACCLPLLVYI